MFYGVERFTNDAQAHLNAGINVTATSFTVTDGSRFPDNGVFRIMVDEEIMIVTSRSGSLFTVIRGAEETQAVSHSAGALVVHVVTKGSIYAVSETNMEANVRLTYSPTDVNSSSSSGSVLYALPYSGNKIALYDPTEDVWNKCSVGEGLSVPLPPAPGGDGTFWPGNSGNSSNIFDVFCFYDESIRGARLELSVWRNASERTLDGTVVRQDGVWVKANQKNKRLVGTIMTVPTNMGHGLDSPQRRYIWNAQNQVPRNVSVNYENYQPNIPNGISMIGNTKHNFFHYVCGLREGFVDVESNLSVKTDESFFGDSYHLHGFGDNTTSVIRSDTVTSKVKPYYSSVASRAIFKDVPQAGYRNLVPLQICQTPNGTGFNLELGGSGLAQSGMRGSYLS